MSDGARFAPIFVLKNLDRVCCDAMLFDFYLQEHGPFFPQEIDCQRRYGTTNFTRFLIHFFLARIARARCRFAIARVAPRRILARLRWCIALDKGAGRRNGTIKDLVLGLGILCDFLTRNKKRDRHPEKKLSSGTLTGVD